VTPLLARLALTDLLADEDVHDLEDALRAVKARPKGRARR